MAIKSKPRIDRTKGSITIELKALRTEYSLLGLSVPYSEEKYIEVRINQEIDREQNRNPKLKELDVFLIEETEEEREEKRRVVSECLDKLNIKTGKPPYGCQLGVIRDSEDNAIYVPSPEEQLILSAEWEAANSHLY
jgi:hypothetical protein